MDAQGNADGREEISGGRAQIFLKSVETQSLSEEIVVELGNAVAWSRGACVRDASTVQLSTESR